MGSQTKRIQYQYDKRGNRSALIDHDGGRFTYSYDSLNRITQVQNPQGDRTSFSYDNAGRRTLKKLANGTRASFAYDPAGNLAKLYNLKSDGTVISSFDYQYDKVGNRTAVREADGSRVTWSYDATYQLTGEHRTGSNAYRDTYTYDPTGNRLVKIHDGARTTSAYDAANQLRYTEDAAGRTTYTFDADGNQQRILAPNGDRTTYVWDYENRMTRVELPSGIRNTMAYEPEGLRVKLEESTGVKKFVWDEQNYLAETDGSNDTQVVYTNEPRRYGNLVSQRRLSGGVWTPHWYHFDAIGSTRELTTAGQVVSDTRLYDAWGVIIAIAGSTSSTLLFGGETMYRLDTAVNQLYVRARAYYAEHGRWLSMDPIPSGTEANRYLYVGNQPNVLVDPSGMQPAPAGAPIVAGGACNQNEKNCIAAAIQMIQNAIAADPLCLDQAGLACPKGRTKCDSAALSDCIDRFLSWASFRCQPRGAGGCHPAVGGMPKNRAHTITVCGLLKGMATKPFEIPATPPVPLPSPFGGILIIPPLPGCSIAPCEYSPPFLNDCSACPNFIMAWNVTDLCRDVAPVPGDISSYCNNAADRRLLASILVHEAAHSCVGGHDTTVGKGHCDECGRNDSYDIEEAFMKVCLPN